ncbi:MAG: acyl-CoA carboxylase subunit epsilon [Streptosporangiales bacterium]|nr:acyl-CoA carboxylase subunit epsilon [Streptosporangiales bacterium]
MSDRQDAAGERPVLRIVRGDPTPDEVAALVAALRVRSARQAAGTPAQPRVSAWADRANALRRPLPHGRDAWRRYRRPR